jgi:hypothetical protein
MRFGQIPLDSRILSDAALDEYCLAVLGGRALCLFEHVPNSEDVPMFPRAMQPAFIPGESLSTKTWI